MMQLTENAQCLAIDKGYQTLEPQEGKLQPVGGFSLILCVHDPCSMFKQLYLWPGNLKAYRVLVILVQKLLLFSPKI